MRNSQSLYLYLLYLKKYFNMNTNDNTTEFDAIVVGTGISGGWAAKELTEKGLKNTCP